MAPSLVVGLVLLVGPTSVAANTPSTPSTSAPALVPTTTTSEGSADRQASIDPPSGLVDGQVVAFSAIGFPPQAELHLAQCVYTGGPYGRACQGLRRVTSDDAGEVHTDFRVSRYVEVGGQGPRDCTQRGCFLGIGPNASSDHFPDAAAYLQWALVVDPGPAVRPPLPASAGAVYTSIWSDSGVVPVATGTRTPSPTISVSGGLPDRLAVAPRRRALYGTTFEGVFLIDLNGSRASQGSDGSRDRQSSMFVLRFGCERIVVTSDESLAVVTAPEHHELVVIDLIEEQVRHTTRIDGYAEDVAVDPRGRTAWVAVTTRIGARLTPVDLTTGRRGVPIPLPLPVDSILRALALSPDGTRAYVTSSESDEIIPVDLVARTALPAISLPNSPYDIELTSDGSTAVVTSLWDDTVTVVDLAEGAAGIPIPVAEEPMGLDIDETSDTAYVATSHGLTPVDLVSGFAAQPISLDGQARDAIVVPTPGSPPPLVPPPAPAPAAHPTAATPRFTG